MAAACDILLSIISDRDFFQMPLQLYKNCTDLPEEHAFKVYLGFLREKVS